MRIHGKNDFPEGSKILLDAEMKIMLSNFVGLSK